MKLDRIRVAQLGDLDQVAKLYREVCAHQPLDEFVADWTWGEYPSVAGLRDYIHNERVIIGIKDDQVVAAGVLTTGEDYPQVDWPIKVPDHKIGVLHLFTVHPDFRRTGIAMQMFQGVLNEARQEGKKVIHLDVLADNLSSEKLYTKAGFHVVKSLVMHYDDIGDRDAKVMEYRL